MCLAGIYRQRADQVRAGHQRDGDDGLQAELAHPRLPGLELRLLLQFAQADRAALADAVADWPLTGSFVLVPADLQLFGIATGAAGAGQYLQLFLLYIADAADQCQLIALVGHDRLAYRLQQLAFIPCLHQCLIGTAIGLYRP